MTSSVSLVPATKPNLVADGPTRDRRGRPDRRAGPPPRRQRRRPAGRRLRRHVQQARHCVRPAQHPCGPRGRAHRFPGLAGPRGRDHRRVARARRVGGSDSIAQLLREASLAHQAHYTRNHRTPTSAEAPYLALGAAIGPGERSDAIRATADLARRILAFAQGNAAPLARGPGTRLQTANRIVVTDGRTVSHTHRVPLGMGIRRPALQRRHLLCSGKQQVVW